MLKQYTVRKSESDGKLARDGSLDEFIVKSGLLKQLKLIFQHKSITKLRNILTCILCDWNYRKKTLGKQTFINSASV